MTTNGQEKNYNYAEGDNAIRTEHIDQIEEMLALTDPTEMDSRIFKNSLNISRILKSFYKKLSDNFYITQEETDVLLYCLKFVDMLNLFMNQQSIDSLNKIIFDINELVLMINNIDSKDIILKKIRYTEMTVIYHKKKLFKNLFFGDGYALGQEIERCLDLVTLSGAFDQKLFKQMQNVFYVVQTKIEETYRRQIQLKFNEMKIVSVKHKKGRYNCYEEFDDNADYKNFSHHDTNTQDYYDNFNENFYPGSVPGVISDSSAVINNSNSNKSYAYNANANIDSGNYQEYYNNANNNYYGYNNSNNFNNNAKVNNANAKYKKNNTGYYNNRKGSYTGTGGNNPVDNTGNIIMNTTENNNTDGNTNTNVNTLNTNLANETILTTVNVTEEPAVTQINKIDNTFEVVTTVAGSHSKQAHKNSQTYYNDNFFKNYVYYYDKSSPNQPDAQVNAQAVNIQSSANLQTPNAASKKIKNSKNKKKNPVSGQVIEETTSTTNPIINTNVHSYDKNNYVNYNNNFTNYVPQLNTYQEIQTELVHPVTENVTHTDNTVQPVEETNIPKESTSSGIEPPEIISVQVGSGKGKYNNPAYNNYKNTPNANQNYKYPNGNYYNSYNNNYAGAYNNKYYQNTNAYQQGGKNENYYYSGNTPTPTNSNSSNNFYNNATNNIQQNYSNTKTYKNESDSAANVDNSQNSNVSNMSLLNYRKQSNTNSSANSSSYNNTKYPKNKREYDYNSGRDNHNYKQGQLKHEFVDYDELSKKNAYSAVMASPEGKFVPLVEELALPLPKSEEQFNLTTIINTALNEEKGKSPTKNNLVDIDVEKMFANDKIELKKEVQMETPQGKDAEEMESQGVEQEEECDDSVDELEDVEDLNDEEINEEINRLNNAEEEEEEDSDSADNEMIEAEFDKFMRDANMVGANKNYTEDYYADRESNTKNNKVIFEDDTTPNPSAVINPPANETATAQECSDNANNKEDAAKEPTYPQNNQDNMKESTRSFMDSLKSIDPKVLMEIRGKLNEEGKKTEENNNNLANNTQVGDNSNMPSNMPPNMNNLTNMPPNMPTNMPGNLNYDEFMQHQRQYNKVPIQNYIFSNYAHFFYRGRDSNIHREYFALKCLEQENSSLVTKNVEQFENKILVPIYQRINFNVNKKRGIYFYTFTKYKKLIYRVLGKDKILKKVKPYGSYMNNFLIDNGDIDICIVPKCGILEFSNYLEKIKEEIAVLVR
jgi:hypothetical protein